MNNLNAVQVKKMLDAGKGRITPKMLAEIDTVIIPSIASPN